MGTKVAHFIWKGGLKMDDVKNVAAAENKAPVTAEQTRNGTPDAHDFVRAAYHARKNPDRTPSTPMSGG